VEARRLHLSLGTAADPGLLLETSLFDIVVIGSGAGLLSMAPRKLLCAGIAMASIQWHGQSV
jgi:hypothetical protein